ncbi:hypothetical protein B0H14DRAFT_3875548 [Mycena olivaceomarginata]|nr:hypothetical protein B0H14DRAFT_3875548 [Mycena olivaceomarginata]
MPITPPSLRHTTYTLFACLFPLVPTTASHLFRLQIGYQNRDLYYQPQTILASAHQLSLCINSSSPDLNRCGYSCLAARPCFSLLVLWFLSLLSCFFHACVRFRLLVLPRASFAPDICSRRCSLGAFPFLILDSGNALASVPMSACTGRRSNNSMSRNPWL